MAWTLSDIRNKVRQVTGRLNANSLSTSKLDQYINNFYQYTFPAEVKLEAEHTYYEFNTTANTQQYTFPSTTYTNVEPPLYVDNMPVYWYQDPVVFEDQNPTNVSRATMATGDGTTTLFTTTIQQPPIFAGSVIVTDNTETFTDNGSGTLSGSAGGSGTVNYTAGTISVSFNTAPTSGQVIYLSYIIYVAGRPTACLLYNNVFTLYPIPDTVYRCKIKGYRIETPMTQATDTPRLQEWGEAIAYGAARQIVADFAEFDRYRDLTILYKEQINYILTRTHQNLLNTRARPMF